MVLHRTNIFYAAALVLSSLLCSAPATAGVTVGTPTHADFRGQDASPQARATADWAVATQDSQGLPFLIVDKVAARLFVFDAHGALAAATPVLLGGARGDVSPPGIGDKALSQIAPTERITPAGRFIASKGINLAGRDIVWVDYAAAIAIHRASDVKPGATTRDRLKRLSSATPDDRRISFGCINVSDAFYDSVVRPAFASSSGIVYILPEKQQLAAVARSFPKAKAL